MGCLSWWVETARAGDGASACALLEAATREVEESLGLGHPGVRAASRRAEALFASLSSEERERVRTLPPPWAFACSASLDGWLAQSLARSRWLTPHPGVPKPPGAAGRR